MCCIIFPADLQASSEKTAYRADITGSRSFDMGCVPIPAQPLTTKAWLDTFDLLGKNADYVLHHAHVDWSDFVKGANVPSSRGIEDLKFISGMSRKNNLKLFVVIDPLSPDREKIDPALPRSIGANFRDRKVREAFKNYSLRIAREFRPHYMGLGSEINIYLSKHPGEIRDFFSLYRETCNDIKKILPDTKITSTFQFETLSGVAGNTAQWQILKLFEPKLDAVAITTYPSPWFETPDKMPPDYYSKIKKYTRKPIIVAESGWPSEGEKRYHASAENQERFLLRFIELNKDVKLKLWIWWFLHDWKSGGYADFFKTMGLISADGKEKPSWVIWQKIHELPKNK